MIKQTKHRLLLMLPVMMAIVAMLPLLQQRVAAGGGRGSVWGTGVTSSTISIAWSLESKMSPSGTDPYKVCYKESWAIEGACESTSGHRTSNQYYTLSGLKANEEYKIKVICWCKKGKHKARWHKIGTTKIRTAATTPNVGQGLAWVSEIGQNSLTVNWTYPYAHDFTSWRVCYKNTWYPISLDNMCEKANIDQNDKYRGYYNVDIYESSATLPDLRRHKQYKIMVCGYNSYGVTCFGTTTASTKR